MAISDRERLIRQKLKDDFTHFALKCLKIRTKNGTVEAFALNKAQQSATAVQNKAKTINTVPEFSGAFGNWFKTLGLQPNKFSKSVLRTEVDKVLTNLGFK